MAKPFVVSANFGGFDTVKPIPDDDSKTRCRWLYLADTQQTLDEASDAGWEVIDFKNFYLPQNVLDTADAYGRDDGGRYLAKFPKWAPQVVMGNAPVYFWTDSSITLKAGWYDLAMGAFGDGWFLAHPHRLRNCVYNEVTFSSGLAKYWSYRDDLAISAGLALSLGIPKHDGLWETGFLGMRNVPKLNQLSQLMVQGFTETHLQDQVLLPIAMWALNERPTDLPFKLPENDEESVLLRLSSHATH